MFRLLLLLFLVATPALAQSPAPFVPDPIQSPNFIAPYAPEGSVPSPVSVEPLKTGWKMTATAGGSLGVKLNVQPFDAEQLTRMSFDAAFSPDAKVNLFLHVNGRYFAILLTGPKTVRAGTQVIYDANISKPSGHIEIPLRAALRSQFPGADKLLVDELLAGNWDNSGYLMAGIGGNGPGASWSLSNFKIERSSASPSFGPGRFQEQELVIPAQNLDALNWRRRRRRIAARRRR